MIRISETEAQKIFRELLDRVATTGEWVIVQREGKDLAVITPPQDLALIYGASKAKSILSGNESTSGE